MAHLLGTAADGLDASSPWMEFHSSEYRIRAIMGELPISPSGSSNPSAKQSSSVMSRSRSTRTDVNSSVTRDSDLGIYMDDVHRGSGIISAARPFAS